jgi:hypothetical protein
MTRAHEVTLLRLSQGPYGTDDEIQFIDGLGRGVWSDGVHAQVGRAALLKGYIAGAERRTVWGRISADAAIAHARKALREELGEVAAC